MADRRGEYSRLPMQVEMVKLTHTEMSRQLALETLGLKGTVPSPKLYEEKAFKLLQDNGDDLIKTTVIHCARSRLQADHRAAIHDMQETLTTAYAEFNEILKPYIDSEPDYKSIFTKYGKMLYEQGVALCRALEQPAADMQYAELAYRREVDSMIEMASKAVPETVRIGYTAGLRTLVVNITQAYENTRDDVMEEVFDQIDLFKEEFTRYLQDILDLKTYERTELETAHQQAQQPLLHEPRYEKALLHLHHNIKKLGDHYFTELRKEGANIQELQIAFAKAFQRIMNEAQQSFAQVPGIWMSLHPILKIICACLIIPALIILCCEKPADRHRLFHGAPKGEIDMEAVWKEWHMDMMPDPSGKVSRPKHE